MYRSLPAPGGETLTPACGRGSPASTSGRTAAGWQRLSGQSSRGNSPQHCGSTSSLVPSRADGACRLEHHWDDPGTPWLSCSSDVQGAGGLLQQCDRAAASSWGASRRRRVVACSLSSTLAPVHGWGSSITEAMARALVRTSLSVALLSFESSAHEHVRQLPVLGSADHCILRHRHFSKLYNRAVTRYQVGLSATVTNARS